MAVTFDFGKCAACGDNNSKTLQQCRSCAAALPWAKGAKAPSSNLVAPNAPLPNAPLPNAPLPNAPLPNAPLPNAPLPNAPRNAGPQNAPAKPKIGLGDIAYGAMAVQLLGGFLFVAGVFLWCGNVFRFFPTFPFVGYIIAIIGGAIWRFGAEMD